MYTTNDLGNIILQWKHLKVTAKQQHIISDLKKKWKFNPDCINSEIPEIHTDDITGRMKQKNSNVYKCILIHVLKEKK